MKIALIKWLFSRLIPGLIGCAALGAGAGGFTTQVIVPGMMPLRRTARVDALASQLLHKEASLELNKNRLSANIGNAANDDNIQKPGGFTDLGPRGLRLYEQALGYAGDGRARHGD